MRNTTWLYKEWVEKNNLEYKYERLLFLLSICFLFLFFFDANSKNNTKEKNYPNFFCKIKKRKKKPTKKNDSKRKKNVLQVWFPFRSDNCNESIRWFYSIIPIRFRYISSRLHVFFNYVLVDRFTSKRIRSVLRRASNTLTNRYANFLVLGTNQSGNELKKIIYLWWKRKETVDNRINSVK